MPGYVKGLTHGTGQSPSRFLLYSAFTLSGQEQPNNTNGRGQDDDEE